MNSSEVPLVDFEAAHAAIASDLSEELNRVFAGMHLFLGPNVQQFQVNFAEYLHVRHCIGVADGTEACISPCEPSTSALETKS